MVLDFCVGDATLDVFTEILNENINEFLVGDGVWAILIELFEDFLDELLFEDVLLAEYFIEIVDLHGVVIICKETLVRSFAVFEECRFLKVNRSHKEVSELKETVVIVINAWNYLVQLIHFPLSAQVLVFSIWLIWSWKDLTEPYL